MTMQLDKVAHVGAGALAAAAGVLISLARHPMRLGLVVRGRLSAMRCRAVLSAQQYSGRPVSASMTRAEM